MSTIFSDGASRIFATSNSVTSAKDTDFSSGSNDLLNISSNSVRFTDTDSELISESLTPKTLETIQRMQQSQRVLKQEQIQVSSQPAITVVVSQL